MAKNGRQQAKSAAASSAGVTIVELLVVILIISIVAAIAFMQSGAAPVNLKRQNIARELKVALERARFDSVRRRAECTSARSYVTVNAESFTLTTFQNVGGVLTAQNETTNFASQDLSISTGGSVLAAPVTVSFNQRGEAAAVSGGSTVTPNFQVCSGACTSGTAMTVLVTPTGTVNMLFGINSGPTFAPPGGTASATDEINDDLILDELPACS